MACEKFPSRTIVLHGTKDKLVPYKFGKKVAACSNAGLNLYDLGHNDIYSNVQVFKDIRNFIEKIESP